MRGTSHVALGVLAVVAGISCSSESRRREVGNNLPSAFSISSETAQERAFTVFETGQVRPLALSGNGQFLYATNTPDNRLEIFKITGAGLNHLSSVPVGLEPLAVAEHKSGEVWVVNHLSDSVSIVNVSDPGNAFVTHTLLVGDEPRDIVFAGPNRSRAFVTTAHRGQNTGRDPQLICSRPAPSPASATSLSRA